MSKRGKTNYNYQYDNTARSYVETVEPIKKSKRSEKVHKSSNRRYKYDALSKKYILQAVGCVGVLFISSMLYVGNYVSLRGKQNELNTLKQEKIAVSNAIAQAESQKSKKLNLEEIRSKAEGLGMRKPLPHQVVYIDLPEKSHTTYN